MKELPQINPQSYEPLREQVYEILRKAILHGLLEPGEQITEVSIAEQLMVSRTPAREAIRMLEQEGFIVMVPRRGAFVAGIRSTKEITDIFQVRVALEGLAARLAAKSITQEQLAQLHALTNRIEQCIAERDVKTCIKTDKAFHRLITEAANNDWLQKILENLFEQFTRFRFASLEGEARMKALLQEHSRLAEAIENRDEQRAEELARDHLQNAMQRVITAFKQQ